ncbi:MAG: hypothetical protein QM479_15015 [Pseudomonadota bacterium]
MEIWYLVIGIGSLLFVTSFINNIAEAIERKKRKNKMEILRLKRCIDSLSEYMDELKDYNLPKEVIELFQNEIFFRLQRIQSIDETFHGIEDLISASKQQQEENSEQPEEQSNDDDFNEAYFQNKISILRNLTKYLQEIPLRSKQSIEGKLDYHDILMVFRFEKLNRFYTKKAQQALTEEKFSLAKDHINQIIGTIALSGHISPKLSEINEQATMMLEEIEIQKKQYYKALQEKETDKKNEESEQDQQKDAG